MIKSKILLFKVDHRELEMLQTISRETFIATYAAQNTEENMKNYLSEYFSKPKLASALSDLNTEFYFAKNQNEIVGYIKLNWGQSQTDLIEQKGIELERIYVLNKYQGNYIGQFLCEQALQIAKDRDFPFLWLGVWEKNSKAIGFYRKHGFVEFDRHVFKLGDDKQIDIMMKLNIEHHHI